MLFLESENPDKDIFFYINSPGGSFRPVWPSTTRCSSSSRTCRRFASAGGEHGRAADVAGDKDKRFAAAELARHDPPADGRLPGPGTDIEIHAKEILYLRGRLNEIMAKHTGKSLESSRATTDATFSWCRRSGKVRNRGQGAGVQGERVSVRKELFGEKLLYCSFCGKSQHEVRKLIAGPSVFICDECHRAVQRHHSRGDGFRQGAKGAKSDLPTPREIRQILDQ